MFACHSRGVDDEIRRRASVDTEEGFMTTAFGIEKENLADILRGADEGKTQLPEFQRGWVWDDSHVRSLLASVSLSYPIGAVMMLAGGGETVHFKERPIEGATIPSSQRAERLILDGQQRLTSLYQSLALRKPVMTRDVRGKAIERWYYVDINKALDPQGDREESIISVPADRQVRDFRGELLVDYSTPAHEYASMMFPLADIFDPSDWRVGFESHWNYERQKIELWNSFERDIVRRFQMYHVPVIELSRDTPKEAVCAVFEKVNTGGVTLTVFELLTATFAADDFDLREDWDRRSRQIRSRGVLRDFSSTEFLQIVTLLTTYARNRDALSAGTPSDRLPGVSAKRADMLKLRKDDYIRWADEITRTLDETVRFLHLESIFDARFLPYSTQVVPLTAIISVLGRDWHELPRRTKLSRWYWSGVFGELYGSTTETRFARDVVEVVDWVRGGPEPRTLEEANFAPGRLQTLRTRGSAAYKGLYLLLLREGAKDFRTGQPSHVDNYFDAAVDIHHIFPQAWCQSAKIPPAQCDSIVNKTPLSARTNRSIGGRAPSQYLKTIEQQGVSPDDLDRHVASHLVDPRALREDDFVQFYAERSEALLQAIEKAIGKPVQRERPAEEVDENDDYEVVAYETGGVVEAA
jgi:hypothetical protein